MNFFPACHPNSQSQLSEGWATSLQAVDHPFPDDKLSIQDFANWTFVQQNNILFSAVHTKQLSFSVGNQSWSKLLEVAEK